MEDKLKSLEGICSPIISKMYQGGARPCLGLGVPAPGPPAGGDLCLSVVSGRPARSIYVYLANL